MKKKSIFIISVFSIIMLFFNITNLVNAASSDTGLKKIEIEPQGIEIVQDRENNKIYRTKVDNSVTSIIVKAQPNNDKAQVEIKGNEDLDVGTNKITIKVVAEDGNSETYLLYVRRADIPIAEENIIPNVQGESSEESMQKSTQEDNLNNSNNSNITQATSQDLEEDDNEIATSDEESSKNNPMCYIVIALGAVIIGIVIVIILVKRKVKNV